MKVNYEHKRLQMLPENEDEKKFANQLVHSIQAVNKIMAWFGDVSIEGEEKSGYVLTLRKQKPDTEESS